jgi:hypothetical protein
MRAKSLGFLVASLLIMVLTGVWSQGEAGVSVGIGVALPPPIVVQTPPAMVVLPSTPGVYVAPGLRIDLFFWNGWWWRPWRGHWYRSRYYDHGWVYYKRGVPGFYGHVNPGWRGYYRSHSWDGRPWNYRVIPHDRFARGPYGHYPYHGHYGHNGHYGH